MGNQSHRRIAVFTTSLENGGAERVCVTLANGFRAAGYQVDMVLVKRSGSLLSELDQGVSVVDLGASRTMLAVWPMVRYLRRTRPDVLLTTLAHVNVIAVLAKALARVPVRLVVREAVTASVYTRYTTEVGARVLNLVRSRAYNMANWVISPSRGVAEDLIQKYGVAREHVTVISNPLDVPRIRDLAISTTDDRFDCSIETPFVLGVGRLSGQKDFSTLIRAFAKVLETRRATLLILGEGEDRDLLACLIKSLAIEKHVAMPGFVDNPFAYMQRASVYVLSSRYEGLPNTLLQAMALGVPVVATDCPSGPREILEEGRWGRLVPVGDVDRMAGAILDGLGGRLERIPVPALEERYGIENITRQYLDVLFT